MPRPTPESVAATRATLAQWAATVRRDDPSAGWQRLVADRVSVDGGKVSQGFVSEVWRGEKPMPAAWPDRFKESFKIAVDVNR